MTGTSLQFKKERTSKLLIDVDLEKILKELGKNINLVISFDEDKIEEMRERTEAYFKEYTEIQDGEWTIVLSEETGQKKTGKDAA